ncbi:MAG: HD domain-containing protein [Treponema sp.]|nr:HD domain-containing protein [Treponema sp.]
MATPEAVIEIGSTGVRLLVAELTPENKRNVLDRSELPLPLGRDVFTSFVISRETQNQCVQILKRFREQLEGWGITPEQTSVVAASAFREAKNRDPVMDRILVQTGFRVRIMDGIEENRLMYLAVAECLKEESVVERTKNTMILEVSGGSTEVMMMRQGKMAGVHSLKLGTVRIEQQLRSSVYTYEDMRRYIREAVVNTKGSLDNELDISEVEQFMAVGIDMTLAAINVGKPLTTFLWEIDVTAFDRFVRQVQNYSVDECVAKFKISYNDAQTLQASLLIYNIFIRLTNVQKILVPETNIRDGLIISKTSTQNEALMAEFNSQITASAKNLLRKFHGDESHAECVRQNALKLYEAMKAEIGLDEHAKLLLEVAAILHDIGIFIHLNHHNVHSHYIIKNSEIFGLSETDRSLISQIAKYHRGKLQPQDDESFVLQPRTYRMTILKLTAVLRVADALDRSHSQSFEGVRMNLTGDVLNIKTDSKKNTVLENMALAEKGELFETVFGYKVVLS